MGNDFAPSCAVIICTRDRPEHLDQCLEAATHLTYPKFDILVVDNVPKDARSREVAKRRSARYVVEPVAGLSRARNCGARACDAEILAYLDDDSQPAPDWLTSIVVEFQDAQVIAVTGRICALENGGEVDRLGSMIGGVGLGSHDRRITDQGTPSWFELANFGGIGDGGNMAFRRSAFDVWPGFDERLGRGAILDGGEEHYAFFSLIDRGYRIVYTPCAVVWHPYPRSMQELRLRYLHSLTASTGYMTLLLIEQPRYRRATLKYILEGLRGIRRTWRGQVMNPDMLIVSHWRRVLAYLAGPLLYIRVRFASSFTNPAL